MTKLNVLIVDDSPFMRKVFGDVVDAEGSFRVIATAANGDEAIAQTLKLRPDIITMDMEMPKMNGLEALRKIMAVRPTPIIMLSAVTDNGARDTIKALQYGAFDFIRKPDGSSQDLAKVGEQLIEKLHIAATAVRQGSIRAMSAFRDEAEEPPASPSAAAPTAPPPAPAGPASPRPASAKPAGRKPSAPEAAPRPSDGGAAAKRPAPPTTAPPPQAEAGAGTPPAAAATVAAGKPPAAREPRSVPASKEPKRKAEPSASFGHIVAVGTSTGGPRALHELLTGIPAEFPAPILVVQHMPPKFTHSLAQRLDSFCAIRVREATDGEPVETSTAYIAPGGRQMKLHRDPSGAYRIRLTDDPPRSGHKPSVDTLFESLVGYRELKRHAVLMTGMGSDGAKGMKALKDDGAVSTIAEAEETCIVYGMPRSAVELEAATKQLPLPLIAAALVNDVRARAT